LGIGNKLILHRGTVLKNVQRIQERNDLDVDEHLEPHTYSANAPAPLNFSVAAQAVCGPLLAASSIKVRNTAAPFKPEYVVPQVILQWLTTETNLDGVRCLSTKVHNYFNSPNPASNFILPARSSKPSGYCDHLRSKFEPTDSRELGRAMPRIQLP
jgi:hypothetical protein